MRHSPIGWPHAVERALALLPRKEIADASWRDYGAIIVVAKLDDARDACRSHRAGASGDRHRRSRRRCSRSVRHAGAIFLGRHTPEAMGDYIAGPNHVLPTSRTARFSSGLSVLDFLKRTTLLSCTPRTIAALGPDAITLAEAEGLEAHARSIAARLNAKIDELLAQNFPWGRRGDARMARVARETFCTPLSPRGSPA